MTDEQRKTFDAMCARFGLDDAQKAEIAAFVEQVSEAAHEGGMISGASPFDGTWPSQQES